MDGFYRKQEDKDFSMYKPNPSKSFENEWQNDNRIDESAWIQRYDYESDLVVDIIQENKLKNILEFGSGPGKMSDIIQKKLDYDVSYTMIGEHSDLLTEVKKWTNSLSEAEENLETLKRNFDYNQSK